MTYFLADLLSLGMVNAIMVLGLNLQYGFAGSLNFTYYTFVAIGAYVSAVTTMGTPKGYGFEQYILHWQLPWPIGLLLGGLVAALAGVFVLSLAARRVRSDYLAIVTVSIGFIFFSVVNNYLPLFDGANGLFGIPYILGGGSMSSLSYTATIGAIACAVLVILLVVSRRIYRSPYGRVLRAIREDHVVAESFGRSALRSQLGVFAVGSFFGGIAGGLLIFYAQAWSPQAWLPQESFVLMAAIVIGGTGNYWGAMLGAFVVIELLTEVTRYLPAFGNGELLGAGRAIVIGLAMILIVRFRPQGIIPERPDAWYRSAKALTSRVSESVRTSSRRVVPRHE